MTGLLLRFRCIAARRNAISLFAINQDVDIRTVYERVVDWRERDQVAQFLQICRLSLDFKLHTNGGKSLWYVTVQTQETVQVDVPLEFRFELLNMHTKHRGMGDHTGGDTTRQRVEQMLNRIGAIIFPRQDRRFVAVKFKCLFVLHRLLCTVEVGDCCTVMYTTTPFVAGAESASAKFRVILDRAHRFLQHTEIDAVDRIDLENPSCISFDKTNIPRID